MSSRKIRSWLGVALVLPLCTLAPRVSADSSCEVDYDWIRPCVGGLTCESPGTQMGALAFGLPAFGCWCEGDWDADDLWTATATPACCTPEQCYEIPFWPQETYHHPWIVASNTRTCAGGTNGGAGCDDDADCPSGGKCKGACAGGTREGQPCSTDNNCPGAGATCATESHLLIRLIDETVGDLVIETEVTQAADDQLKVHFEGQDEINGNTLTAARITFDATNGAVTVRVKGATLQTEVTP